MKTYSFFLILSCIIVIKSETILNVLLVSMLIIIELERNLETKNRFNTTLLFVNFSKLIENIQYR